MTNPMENELIRLRALEPDDVQVLYKWENDTEVWKVSNTIVPFSKYMLLRTSSVTFSRRDSCA